ncbi:hypothetical protein SAY86_016357 [Trapa natans]|uniref:Uncharacterized protein n=1 Tax=Trapa natans TaxID=22666 RepID=A0AAN7QZT8_TRANT|nr:hypothetical protein SAY86_016357 [Trapa natans]
MACPPGEHDGQTVRKSRASHIASCCGLMLQLRELPSTYGTWFLQIPRRPMNGKDIHCWKGLSVFLGRRGSEGIETSKLTENEREKVD